MSVKSNTSLAQLQIQKIIENDSKNRNQTSKNLSFSLTKH